MYLEDEKIDAYFNKIYLNYTLSEQESNLLENEIDENECFTVWKRMKTDKTPGCDSLPSEFYLTFWDHVKTLLLKSFKYSFSEGKLPISQRKSIISLMFKKGD